MCKPDLDDSDVNKSSTSNLSDAEKLAKLSQEFKDQVRDKMSDSSETENRDLQNSLNISNASSTTKRRLLVNSTKRGDLSDKKLNDSKSTNSSKDQTNLSLADTDSSSSSNSDDEKSNDNKKMIVQRGRKTRRQAAMQAMQKTNAIKIGRAHV